MFPAGVLYCKYHPGHVAPQRDVLLCCGNVGQRICQCPPLIIQCRPLLCRYAGTKLIGFTDLPLFLSLFIPREAHMLDTATPSSMTHSMVDLIDGVRSRVKADGAVGAVQSDPSGSINSDQLTFQELIGDGSVGSFEGKP